MNRLFSRLRTRREEADTPEALPGFDERIEALRGHAQQAARYEDELLAARQDIAEQLWKCEMCIEQSLADGEDRNALEYVRLIARLRPQYDLLDRELRSFAAVAGALITRLDTLLNNLDEAKVYARSAAINAEATNYLDETLTRLTRYFVLLDRVASARRRELPDQLAMMMLQVIDDRQLDLTLATYILERRRAITAASSPQPTYTR